VDLGHRRLAQLRGPQGVSSFAGRAQGFESVMATTTARDVSTAEAATAPTAEEGYRLACELLEGGGDRPTAIFAHNDLMAVGAVDAINQLGLNCPRDISVVGYNDSPLTSHVNPPLTTVRLPGLELGRRAATLALAQIAGEDVPPDTLEKFPPELVIRASSAAPLDES